MRRIIEKTVAQPIEEQLIALDGMIYFMSNSANDGSLTISVTFKLGTNPDIATVQTQNRVNIAMPRLPLDVQRQGVVVKKVSTAFLTGVSLISPDNRYDSLFLTNYAQINLLNQLASVEGVGEARLGAAQVYSMRIWVDPDRMAQLGVTASDINDAIRAQNRQNPAGSIGQPPSPTGTAFQYSVSAQGRLVTASEFGDIVLRAPPGHRPAAHSRHRPGGTGAASLQRLQPRQRRPFGQPHHLPFARRQRGGHRRPRPPVLRKRQENLSRRPRLRHPVRLHRVRPLVHSRSDHDACSKPPAW